MKLNFLKQLIILLVLVAGLSPYAHQSLSAQIIGGNNVFEFMNLPSSARLSGLGGSLLGVQDGDISLSLSNPASLNAENHQQINWSHSFHPAGGQHGYAGYARHYEPWNTSFQAGIQYMNYGEFLQTDDIGNIQGEFKAKEFAINLTGAKQVYEKLTAGASLKIISSQFEGYSSFGMAADLGLFYQDTSGRFGAGLVIRNAGIQLNPYVDGNVEDLPFDVQLGFNQTLKHLPFRIGLVIHDLHRWNILYDDPNTQDNDLLSDFNQTPTANPVGDFVDNFFRHMIFNGEFLFGKDENLTFQLAYNHQRRQELSVSYASRSLTGFSFGVGLKIKRFRIAFGHQFYHLAGGNNHLSMSTNLTRW